jgi:hypothetical protein
MSETTKTRRRLPTGAELLEAAQAMIRARYTDSTTTIERRIRFDAEGAALLDALAARLDLPMSAVVRRALDMLAKECLRR